ILRHDHVLVLLVAEAIARSPSVDLRPPLGERPLVGLNGSRLPNPDHVLEHMRAVADHRNIDADILVDRRWIYIDVDLAGARREGVGAPGNAVIEARSDI